MPTLEQFGDLVKQIGFSGALFAVFFFGAHYVLYKMYLGRLDDRQKEIDRLAQDNREYRNRFLAITDDKFSYDADKKRIRKPKGGR